MSSENRDKFGSKCKECGRAKDWGELKCFECDDMSEIKEIIKEIKEQRKRRRKLNEDKNRLF